MATVYLAIQESLDREVALKVMARNLAADESFCRRFLKEGKIIAQLAHPNIVTIYEIGSLTNCNYMALEYATNGNLYQRLNRLTRDESLQIIKNVATALGYAHKRGFLHRDVKPANVLFREDQSLLLSDFGIAKALHSGSQLTMIGWSVGTPAYMSPEQLVGSPATPQSDLYSLGVMFYEMLTGLRPYVTNDPFSMANMHLNAPCPLLPEPLDELNPILTRLLAKDPTDRFATADEVIREIDNVQARDTQSIPRSDKRAFATRKRRLHALLQQPVFRVLRKLPAKHPGKKGKFLVSQILATASARFKTIPDQLFSFKHEHRSALKIGRNLVIGLITINSILYMVNLYVVNLFRPSDEIDLASRSIHPTGASDYIRAKNNELTELVTAYREFAKLRAPNKFLTQEAKRIVDWHEELARSAWAQADQELTRKLIDQGLSIRPQHSGLTQLRRQLQEVELQEKLSSTTKNEITRLMNEARDHLAHSRFILPSGENAVETYRAILRLDHDNEAARRGLSQLARLFEQRAREQLNQGNLEGAMVRVEQALMISPDKDQLLSVQNELMRQKNR